MAGDSRLSARFGASTEDFKNGISEINRELRVLDSGFKASAAGLGDWSSSATGLESRISTLNASIDLQREKVNALQIAYEQQVQAHGADSVAAQNAEITYNKSVETLNKMENELKDTTGALQKMGDTADKAGADVQRSGKKFEGFGKIIDNVKNIVKSSSVVIAGVGVTIKKALDFGQEGAKIVQVEESYNSFIERLGESSDVLENLSAAARGTIDEGDLMAATLQMLTGTSEELSKSLLKNAPALMEIAKASNKLNPTMGDTLSLYEAITTSIKNLTPMGLKQAGIVIDSSAAYAEYAKSIGKAANALTEEEKSMALLNATLEKGPTILQQVGGNTEAATDKFERSNIAIENLKENIQRKLLPVLGDLATGLNLISGGEQNTQVITTAWGNFFNRMIAEGKSATEIIDAYNQHVAAAQKAASTNLIGNLKDENFNEVDYIVKLLLNWGGATKEVTSDQEGLKQALMKSSNSFDEYYRALIQAAGGNADLVNQSNPIVKAFKAQAQAEWDAAHGITGVSDAATQAIASEEALKNSTSQVESAIKGAGLSAEDAEEKINALKIATGQLTPEQEKLNSDTELMAKAYATGAISLDRMSTFLNNAAKGTDDLTDAERQQLTALTQVNQKLRETIGLSSTYGMLTQAAKDLGLSEAELTSLQLNMQASNTDLNDALNTTTTDMQLLAEATALGIYSTTEYGLAMHDAAAGTFELSDAERASVQASVDAEKAKRDQAAGVRDAAQSYLELATSLKGATKAQIAETAIQELGELQKAGKIDFSTYMTAVSELQESFGLSDAKSRALADAMPILNGALASGILPATSYDDALKAIIKDSGDGVINMDAIITKFGVMPASAAAAIGAFDEFDKKLAVVPETAAASAQQTYDAFDTKEWESAGKSAGQDIATGITASTPAIVAAAQAAVQAAINAAKAAGATGPTMPTPPPPADGYAKGGYGKVPSGYPDDSYLIGLTSGEEFFVGEFARAKQNINDAIAGMHMMSNVNVTDSGGAGAAGDSIVTIESGAIVVYALPGMDEEVVAQNVIDKLGDTLGVARSKGLR